MKENLFSVNNIVSYNSKGDVLFNNHSRDQIVRTELPLSYYEIACTPRLINKTKLLEIKPEKIHKIIKEILTCNICLQIYNDPVNIKNCLHKFCRRCIEDFNRRIKKECAICRQNIETRRLLREDLKIKNIIRCLIPNVEKYNEAEDILFQQCLKKTFAPLNSEHVPEKQESNITTVNINMENKDKKEHSHNEKVKIFNISEDRTNILSKQSKEEKSFLEKKTLRNEENSLENIDEVNVSKVTQSKYISGVLNESNSIPLKLSCLDESNYLSKYFSKLKLIVRNENFLLDNISRYICEKMNMTPKEINRITYMIKDPNNNFVDLQHNTTIQNIVQRLNNIEEIILFFKIK